MNMRLGYMGPEGSYSEEAAGTYDPESMKIPFPSIPAVAAAVDSGLADEGVVPIENSLEGSVTFTLDLLIHESDLFIKHELMLPIQHFLLVPKGIENNDIKIIYSHPQALGQCRGFLTKCFPDAEQVASLSTSAAVKDMLVHGGGAAAIANQRAGQLYGGEVLNENIEDNLNNTTRFVVLSKVDHSRTGSDKTSICFSFSENSPGLLYTVMGEFANREINLAKVESRPTKQSLGRYVFLIDFEGHRDDGVVKEALEGLRRHVSMLKVFGSYPRAVVKI